MCGDLVSTCESYISDIVLKEDGAGQLQEDLLVNLGIISNNPLQGLFKGWRCAWSLVFLNIHAKRWDHRNVHGLCV